MGIDSTRPVIFLDIDGVLNHQQWYRYRHKNKLGFRDETEFDPKCIQRLNKLVADTNAIVVLSSSWRITHDAEKMTKLLARAGATFEIHSVTGRCCSGIRGVEIRNWIQKHVNKATWGVSYLEFRRYVILDDDSDMLLWQKDHFFQTGWKRGLTQQVCNQARKFLLNTKNLKEPDCGDRA